MLNIFYEKEVSNGVRNLSEEESKHCSQVLRHQIGDEILIFDGLGGKHHALLTKVSKKSCQFDLIRSELEPPKSFYLHLVIAPTKSTDRMEWMIEKLCEIGVDEITFIETQHSERRKLRIDRMEKKVISAMKQSKNPHLIRINELVKFKEFLKTNLSDEKWIAHVDSEHGYLGEVVTPEKSITILIGPEGDFSSEELKLSSQCKFKPVSLGRNTLRTETAGFVACSIVNTVNRF